MHKSYQGGGGARLRGPLPRPRLLTQFIPFGQRAPSTMLESHLRTFVLLYSFCLLIILYSLSGVRIQTATNGIQKPNGNNISDGLNEYKRSTNEYKRVQTE